MRTADFWLRMLSCWVIFLLGTMTGAWAEEPSQFFPGDGHPVGVVMGISGGPVSIVSAGSASRIVKVGDLMAAGEEISVGAGAKVDVLWDHRALLTLDEEARLHIQELHHGQTEVRLHKGTVRIALSYDAGRMTDRLTLQTTLARIVSRGGILEATVMGEEQRPFFARLVNAHVDLALEVEKELQRNTAARAEKDLPGATAKGAILPTSTGLPSFPAAQAFAGGSSIGTPSSTASSPIPSSPILSPPVASPIQGAGAGAGPAQAGGLNSSGLLKQILNEIGKGSKGQGKR